MTDHTKQAACPESLDGRQCQKLAGHKQRHSFAGIPGENCTCMLRWYPNRCNAHPENNQ